MGEANAQVQGFVEAQGAVTAGEAPTQPGVLWITSWRELDEKGSKGAGRAVQAEGIAPARTLRQRNISGAAGNLCSGSEVLNLRGCTKR